MANFVSALGPNVASKDDDVKYRMSTCDFPKAVAASEKLLLELQKQGSKSMPVIYRLSYDSKKDAFFSWRQPLDGDGSAKDPDDETAAPLAYEIFTAPQYLLGDDGAALSAQVDLIGTHSQMDKPGKAGPPK